MRNPITKLAITAAIIAAVVLGLFEFINTDTGSGVVWAEVARKVEADRGFVFHERFRIVRSDWPERVTYIVGYNAGSRLRQDFNLQPEGQLFKSEYYDFDARTATYVRHNEKTYLRVPMDEKTLQSQESGWRNAKDWLRQFLSGKYTKLGRRTIEGVPCEGIEMTDPTFGGGYPPPTNCVGRLWVSVATGYPVRLEYNWTYDGDRKTQAEVLFDRFQWDVEHDASLFEPNIPPDYVSRGDL